MRWILSCTSHYESDKCNNDWGNEMPEEVLDRFQYELEHMDDETETVEEWIDTDAQDRDVKYVVLVIYDIVSNKQRVKVSKYLSGYGDRVQKSAFEARLNKKQYNKMLEGLEKILLPEDNVRIYKLRGYEEIKTIGSKEYIEEEDIIFI